MSRTDAEILERGHVDDLDAILAMSNSDIDEALHVVADHADAIFTWDYEKGARPPLEKLYEKAKHSMWNGETDLDWSIDVDQERLARESPMTMNAEVLGALGIDLSGTSLASWDDDMWLQHSIESQNWSLSQFMHGEQGALICTAKIVETVPWIDAKYYASTQVMDEARHVEVFAKYLDTKLSGHYPVNTHLRMLLDDIINDSRWDMTYLGMQIMVEGLALAAFGFLHMLTGEPLLKQLLRYVMSDEARHVAFGVLSLQEYYAGLDQAEIRERQEFAFEAAVKLQRRFQAREVFEQADADADAVFAFLEANDDPGNAVFQQMLFSKIVPNCKKLGLLDAGDGWLRQKFTEIEIIQFEDWTDTTDEYESFDAISGAAAQ
ncbi:MAG: ferritin-like domain-containing protein [Microthrixaceae bacterium]